MAIIGQIRKYIEDGTRIVATRNGKQIEGIVVHLIERADITTFDPYHCYKCRIQADDSKRHIFYIDEVRRAPAAKHATHAYVCDKTYSRNVPTEDVDAFLEAGGHLTAVAGYDRTRPDNFHVFARVEFR